MQFTYNLSLGGMLPDSSDQSDKYSFIGWVKERLFNFGLYELQLNELKTFTPITHSIVTKYGTYLNCELQNIANRIYALNQQHKQVYLEITPDNKYMVIVLI